LGFLPLIFRNFLS